MEVDGRQSVLCRQRLCQRTGVEQPLLDEYRPQLPAGLHLQVEGSGELFGQHPVLGQQEIAESGPSPW